MNEGEAYPVCALLRSFASKTFLPSSARCFGSYDGSEVCTDLFQGQHPPPLALRTLEELLAFAHALLQVGS